MMKKTLLIMVLLSLLIGTASINLAQDEPVSGTITIWGWTAAIRDTIEAAGVIDAFLAEYPDVEIEIIE